MQGAYFMQETDSSVSPMCKPWRNKKPWFELGIFSLVCNMPNFFCGCSNSQGIHMNVVCGSCICLTNLQDAQVSVSTNKERCAMWDWNHKNMARKKRCDGLFGLANLYDSCTKTCDFLAISIASSCVAAVMADVKTVLTTLSSSTNELW